MEPALRRPCLAQTLFGADGGGNVLTKATALLAVAFFATSFGLAIVAKDKARTVTDAEIPLPMIEQQREAPTELQDLPALDNDLPAEMVGEDDIPDVE